MVFKVTQDHHVEDVSQIPDSILLNTAVAGSQNPYVQQTSEDSPEPDNPQPAYIRYSDFIHGLAERQSDYRWLQEFFDINRHLSGQTQPSTTVQIFDIDSDDRLADRGQFEDDDATYFYALQTRSPDVRLRLIVFAYDSSYTLKIRMLEQLAYHFNVDPKFLRRHFYYDSDETNRAREKDLIHQQHVPFVYGHDLEELHLFRDRSHRDGISAYLHRVVDRRQDTLLLFVRGPEILQYRRFETSGARLSRPFHQIPDDLTLDSSQAWRKVIIDMLHCIPPNELRLATFNPLYLILGPASVIVLEYHFACQFVRSSIPSTYTSLRPNSPLRPGTSVPWSELDMNYIKVLNSEIEKLRRSLFLTQTPGYDWRNNPHLKALCEASKELTTHFDAWHAAMRRIESKALLEAQVTAALESTTSSLAVNRLTQLAFLFIPLSFTASLFGMNLEVFGQGTVMLPTFFLTAVCISVCSLVPLIPMIRRYIRKVHFRENLTTIYRLGCVDAEASWWYLRACVKFSHPVVRAIFPETTFGNLRPECKRVGERLTEEEAWGRLTMGWGESVAGEWRQRVDELTRRVREKLGYDGVDWERRGCWRFVGNVGAWIWREKIWCVLRKWVCCWVRKGEKQEDRERVVEHDGW